MKALLKLKDGPGNINLKDVDEPTPGPGEVKIKVEAAGVCGTDIKIRHGHAWSNPPVILGHEFCGTIVDVGDSVRHWKVNDQVVSETAQVICGHCEYCCTGSYLMCKDRLSIGYGVNGAFAEYCVVRQELLHRLPDNVDFNSGSLCEPLAVAVHAVYKKTDLSPTVVAAVFGPGPIGLLTAQLLKCFGATVIVCGLSADSDRLKLAKELGIDYTINLETEDIELFLKNDLHCPGIDIVFDCSGTNAAISKSLELLKKKGTLVQIGLPNAPMVLEYGKIVNKELSVIGSFGHSWIDWERALALIASGKVLTKPLLTHEFPLSQWEKAFEVAENGTGIKVLIHPHL
jgi:L-iditol 2-dehydrogenase